MNITELVAMAERIHNAEGYDLGASSTRAYRNAFWARVIGCAYHGHPVYNPAPDRQWHLKNGGGGRPQTDDVAVSMPSRAYWDCIVGVGANGYKFQATGYSEPLPSNQEVYPPPVPAGSGGETPAPGPTPVPTPGTDLAPVLDALRGLEAVLIGHGERLRDIETRLTAIMDEQEVQQSEVVAAVEAARQARNLAQNISDRMEAGLPIVEGRAGWAGSMSGKVKG